MTTTTTTQSPTGSASPTTTASASGNPFSGYQLYVNPYYSSEVASLAIPSLTGSLSSLQAAATAAAKVPSFVWLYAFPFYNVIYNSLLLTCARDTAAKVPTMGDYLADIQSQNAAGANPPIAGQFVVYDLPDRDCAALASNGEYSIADNGVEHYKSYIDSIREILVQYSDVHTLLVIGECLPTWFGHGLLHLNAKRHLPQQSPTVSPTW